MQDGPGTLGIGRHCLLPCPWHCCVCGDPCACQVFNHPYQKIPAFYFYCCHQLSKPGNQYQMKLSFFVKSMYIWVNLLLGVVPMDHASRLNGPVRRTRTVRSDIDMDTHSSKNMKWPLCITYSYQSHHCVKSVPVYTSCSLFYLVCTTTYVQR